MNITLADLLVWMIVGMIAGSLAGAAVKRTKEGFGRYMNMGIGLVGALIGGFLFDLLRIDFGLENIAISLQDIVSAFVGALLFLAALYYGRRWYKKKQQ
jgi:uncharacterized membrane protein YeaQ/YmgE (transglycosylase-associated protein family)